ncbi:glycoside hydrolase family 28 protein [Echinicola strongylocentroti]|uniref:Glycoside hydrolase family 28 protein n=1 Tax=Echinicola strongylocentroti TaxID=1795355 RepID=A0A2Z4IQE0_9BACT|nr:glycoside hydrolase family 28 protein [Echinicola strongylocentroti]AWW32939.1 glycoside hydrolase family 28 protein [Echinicola strongylocentroti]
MNITSKFYILGLAVAMLVASCSQKSEKKEDQTVAETGPWAQLDSIRGLITVPEFPDKDFNITEYGAEEGGKALNTEAIAAAIKACNEAGGGRVVIPQGVYLTGAVHLLSNVNLHLKEGATLRFSRDPKDFLPLVRSRWEGMELMNYSPFIYAYQQENIAITGKGVLDGHADMENWWPWCGAKHFGWKEGMGRQNPSRKLLHEMVHDQVPLDERIFGEGHYMRPQFVQPFECKNVLIQDVKLINAPMWNLHPVLCENVTVERVKIETLGPNNDGCDPEACRNVLIKDCYFDTGDDCIAIKSGRNEDGRIPGIPSENIIIEGCEMKEGHGGVVMGSEISGGVRNVFAQNLVMDSPNLDRVLRIKTSSKRGGTVENIYMRNVVVGTYREAAVRFNMFYEEEGEHIPTIKNVIVENLQVKDGGKYAVMANAYESSPVTNFQMINCRIDGVDEVFNVNHMEDVKFDNVLINGEEVHYEK